MPYFSDHVSVPEARWDESVGRFWSVACLSFVCGELLALMLLWLLWLPFVIARRRTVAQ